MEKSSRLRRLWGKYKWIIPASFIASLVFSLTAIALCRVRGFDGMESYPPERDHNEYAGK